MLSLRHFASKYFCNGSVKKNVVKNGSVKLTNALECNAKKFLRFVTHIYAYARAYICIHKVEGK